MEYPSAAYIATDFHCERSLSSWTDPFILNNGWLVGLADLDTESDYVRERIAAYFTDLLGIGFSGFRIDAAKHIYPESLSAILKKFKDNLGGGDLPEDWISYLEVIMGGEMSMLMC
jgi:alpha-amylase